MRQWKHINTTSLNKKGFNETVETRDIREEEVKQKLYDEIGERHVTWWLEDSHAKDFQCRETG